MDPGLSWFKRYFFLLSSKATEKATAFISKLIQITLKCHLFLGVNWRSISFTHLLTLENVSCRSIAELTDKSKKTQAFKNDLAITFAMGDKIITLQSLAGNA